MDPSYLTSPSVKAEDYGNDPTLGALPSPFSVESTPDLADGTQASCSPAPEATPDPSAKTPAKKPTKKRKSWGQVLPQPKTNLPPRKRAKTEDEKEQRRVERVLRNRRAAQTSRERKREEAEALAQRNTQLEAALKLLQEQNNMLLQELKKLRPEFAGVASNNALTFSTPLFGLELSSQPQFTLDIMNNAMTSDEAPTTVNPMSISPAASPFPEAEEGLPDVASEFAPTINSDDSAARLTQYPAAILCPDLQCQRSAVPPHFTALFQLLIMAYHSWATFLSLWTSPLAASTMFLTTSTPSTKHYLPHLPKQAMLTSIIHLLTSTNSTSKASTSTVSAMDLPKSRRSETLRLRTLRRFLTCNRALARPLLDATLEYLRLSLPFGRESPVIGAELTGQPSTASRVLLLRDGMSMPSTERLLALAWAIRALERSIKAKEIRDEPVAPTDGLGDGDAESNCPCVLSDEGSGSSGNLGFEFEYNMEFSDREQNGGQA